MNNGITNTTTTDTALGALKMALRDRVVTVDPSARRAARALVDLGVMTKPVIAVSPSCSRCAPCRPAGA